METIERVARWMTTSSSANLSKPGPGSMQMRSRWTPARMRVRAWSPKKPMTWRMMGASSGRVKRCELTVGRGCSGRAGRLSSSTTWRRGACVPSPPWSQCMTTRPQSVSAATCTMAGSVKPVTSLMIDAPRRAQSCATSAWRVSTETTAPSATRPRTTGTMRSASSLGETGRWPGRVDSPPTSMMSAPSSSIWRPRWMAASGSRFLPPSENESGVTLRIPMMRGRARPISCLPQRQVP